MDARGYGALRPYVVPTMLDELVGPTEGVITSPRHLGWGPERHYRLDQFADARLLYMRVIDQPAVHVRIFVPVKAQEHEQLRPLDQLDDRLLSR